MPKGDEEPLIASEQYVSFFLNIFKTSLDEPSICLFWDTEEEKIKAHLNAEINVIKAKESIFKITSVCMIKDFYRLEAFRNLNASTDQFW